MRRSMALTAAAALLLLAASLAAAYMSIAAYVERSEEVETRRNFRDWMAKFNKTYDSIGEEEHRYAVYKERLRSNDAKDAAGLLNVFGDLTKEELRSIYTGWVHPGIEADPQNLAADNKALPYSVDWSKKGTGGRGQAVSS